MLDPTLQRLGGGEWVGREVRETAAVLLETGTNGGKYNCDLGPQPGLKIMWRHSSPYLGEATKTLYPYQEWGLQNPELGW